MHNIDTLRYCPYCTHLPALRKHNAPIFLTFLYFPTFVPSFHTCILLGALKLWIWWFVESKYLEIFKVMWIGSIVHSVLHLFGGIHNKIMSLIITIIFVFGTWLMCKHACISMLLLVHMYSVTVIGCDDMLSFSCANDLIWMENTIHNVLTKATRMWHSWH